MTIAVAVAVAFVMAWHVTDVCLQRRLTQAFSEVSYETVIVMPGETLWHIAETHPVAGCSTKEVVHHIRSLNGLENANLSIGARLLVPQRG